MEVTFGHLIFVWLGKLGLREYTLLWRNFLRAIRRHAKVISGTQDRMKASTGFRRPGC